MPQKPIRQTQEGQRLLANVERKQYWRLWGPYLSERQWGTVREDYSDNGDAWSYLSHDQARSRAYRWGEDGLLGICDDRQYLCFALALWNGADRILKERLFGLTNHEGNHGEDVKEYYFYLDSTPTHSYMKALYKYPCSYPYDDLVRNRLAKNPFEYELLDTGAFDNNAYFDVTIEYAKNTPADILIQITVANQGSVARDLHVLPTLWFRNTWSWGDKGIVRPRITPQRQHLEASRIADGNGQEVLPAMRLWYEDAPEAMFTENETNKRRLFNQPNDNGGVYVKDGFHEAVVGGNGSAVNQAGGSKAALHCRLQLAPGESKVLRFRLTGDPQVDGLLGFDAIMTARRKECDEFYDAVSSWGRNTDEYRIQRQAFAGMLWNKQLFHYVVDRWLKGDPGSPNPLPPPGHLTCRNAKWTHMYAKDVLSMPDKWEYPWFAAWDLAFHTSTLAIIDPEFAKNQLLLMVMEWYQHPNGQIPAYEWDFNNINPPVHAWAAWEVFRTEERLYGQGDRDFLRRIFNKLNQNFTWWINRVDREGKNVFQGGFLGLDNIRIFDKDPEGNPIDQSDGTAWMGMYCLNMFKIASELLGDGECMQDMARKYFQHFLYISGAINGANGMDGLWDTNAGFYFDRANDYGRLPVYSLIGLIPLFATEEIVINGNNSTSFFDLEGNMKWFLHNMPSLVANSTVGRLARQFTPGTGVVRGTVSLVDEVRLKQVLARVLDTQQFLSDYGVRSLSKWHETRRTVELKKDGRAMTYPIGYEPAESNEVRFMGGNSNWRGPIWFPINYLLLSSLRKLGGMTDQKYEFPTGSGSMLTLGEIANELANRLLAIFREKDGRRPVYGGTAKFQNDWRDLVLFYEYFHGDSGAGLGASHQTGWTGLIANVLQEMGPRQP